MTRQWRVPTALTGLRTKDRDRDQGKVEGTRIWKRVFIYFPDSDGGDKFRGRRTRAKFRDGILKSEGWPPPDTDPLYCKSLVSFFSAKGEHCVGHFSITGKLALRSIFPLRKDLKIKVVTPRHFIRERSYCFSPSVLLK